MHAVWEHHRPDIMPGPELQPLSSSLAWPWGPQGGASSPPPPHRRARAAGSRGQAEAVEGAGAPSVGPEGTSESRSA